MSDHRSIDVRDRGPIAAEAAAPIEGLENPRDFPAMAEPPPRPQVQAVEQTAILRFGDGDIFFEESAVRLIDEGHDRLLVNFDGVRYLSSDVLGVLASLQERMGPTGGRIPPCGPDPPRRSMARIAQLDRVIEVCDDEANARGLLLFRWLDPPFGSRWRSRS